MNCIKCYQEIPEGSKFCPHCGAEQKAEPASETMNTTYQNQTDFQTPPYYQEPQEPPVNWVPYLVLAIVSTVCCCNLFSAAFGIVGIVYAAKINSANAAGDYAGAADAAKKARIWIIVAFAAGVVVNIIAYMLFAVSGYIYY